MTEALAPQTGVVVEEWTPTEGEFVPEEEAEAGGETEAPQTGETPEAGEEAEVPRTGETPEAGERTETPQTGETPGIP